MTAKTVETDAAKLAEQARSVAEENAMLFAKGIEDYATFARETASELAKSAGVANKAAEKIGSEAVAGAVQSVKDGVAMLRDAAGTRNVADLVELQSNYMAKTCGDLIAKSSAANDVARGAMENVIGVTADRMAAFAGLARKN